MRRPRKPAPPAPILIVGGGVGGLALALSLHERGIPCLVLEAAKDVQPNGAGINILPDATRELAALGLLPGLDVLAIRTRELRCLNRFGSHIWTEARGLHAGHDAPQFSIHRGRLHTLLWQAALQRMGAQIIRAAMRLVGFAQSGDSVTANFADGTSIRGSALIGADGIHSVVRKPMHPDDADTRWNGIQTWRGVADWAAHEGGDVMILAGDTKEKLTLYPIGPGATSATRLTTWVVSAQLGDPARQPPRPQDWSRPGALEDVLPHVQRFRLPWLDVQAMIRATPEIWEDPICDRDPLPFWTRGRVTLLGDAAHPLMGCNGPSEAILDARALAALLARQPIPEALAAYEAQRLPATRELLRTARLGGLQRLMDLVSARAPEGFERLEDVIATDEMAALARKQQDSPNEDHHRA